MPSGAHKWLRNKYWHVKSQILYSRLYKLLDLDYRLQSGLTLKVASKGEWWTYNDIFLNHEYDVAIEEAIEGRSGKNSFTVLDLGGNVGYFFNASSGCSATKIVEECEYGYHTRRGKPD